MGSVLMPHRAVVQGAASVDVLNGQALRHAALRERVGSLALNLPSLLVVCVVLVAPMLWLCWLSVLGPDGAFTTENYARMLRPVYLRTFLTTFEVAGIVTLTTVLLGYPLSYLLSQLPARAAALCMVFVILPFWTSVLVRTYAWMVILQRRGVLNSMLFDAGLIDEPLRLVNNMTGTVIGMTHVMLPCLVFPLYAAMKSIDRGYLRAASNCGATPVQAFWQVFLPLSLPGLSAGVVLVFVLCLGYYITPALLGGGKVMMWAMQIESAISLFSNWGAASALGVGLVVVTLLVLWGLSKLLRVESLQGGK